MPKTIPSSEVVVIGSISFRNAEKAMRLQRVLPLKEVKAEVSRRVAEEFPKYARLADALADAAVTRYAELWGYTAEGLQPSHYAGVLLYLGSPDGLKLLKELGVQLMVADRERFLERRKARRAKFMGGVANDNGTLSKGATRRKARRA